MRRTVVGIALGLTVASGVSAGSAFAGEIGGNGETTPIRQRANSGCAFSGQDDPDVDLETGEDDFGRTQSFGQIIRYIPGCAAIIGGGIPGGACNGHLSPTNPRN